MSSISISVEPASVGLQAYDPSRRLEKLHAALTVALQAGFPGWQIDVCRYGIGIDRMHIIRDGVNIPHTVKDDWGKRHLTPEYAAVSEILSETLAALGYTHDNFGSVIAPE